MDYTPDTIYLMDAFELLERLPDAAADLILTDPPYGIGYQNQFTQTPHPEIIGDGIEECDFDYEHMARECYRILKPNSHAYFFTRYDRYPLHYAALEQAGFTIKNCLVIEKNTVGGIGDLLGSYASNAEWVIFCQKGRRHFFKTQLLRNHRFGGVPGAKRKQVPEFKTRFPACWFGPEYPKSTYSTGWHQRTGFSHPTMKNTACLEWLIQISTAPDALVVDPFMGSGSTALAAVNTGRHFLGCEIVPEYHALALHRLKTII